MCLYHLHEETAQSFIEDNLGRRLTDVELYRIRYSLIEGDGAFPALCDMIYHAALEAMDNTKGQWNGIDDDFKNGINVFEHLNCKE